ncbi:transposase [Planotetraspora thailandica]|uniref:transposase n=1 Tax=Planotetraspora thailandica TaxID=487172 RepID=UPI0035711706
MDADRAAAAPTGEHHRGGRDEKWPRRLILDAIFYVVRGGIAWQLPAGFPPADTVYGFFARWARAGVWQRLHHAVRDRLRARLSRDSRPTAAIIDSQSVQGPTWSTGPPAGTTRKENQRPQTAHRRRQQRASARRGRDRRIAPGP